MRTGAPRPPAEPRPDARADWTVADWIAAAAIALVAAILVLALQQVMNRPPFDPAASPVGEPFP